MASINLIRGSDGTGNAAMATVTSLRSPSATTIQVNTVAGIPATFIASMGTPHTYTDPISGETITVISEATAVDFTGHVDGSNLEIDSIAPGYTDNGSQIGDVVVIRPTTEWANNVHSVLSEEHRDDGKHGDINATSLTVEGVGAVNLPDGSIKPRALDPVITDYSTSEVNTGAKWIDGKDIYKKTVNFGALPNNTTKTVAHGITGISATIGVYGFAKNSAPDFVSLPNVAKNSTYSIELSIASANVSIATSTNYSSYSGYVTLLYTK